MLPIKTTPYKDKFYRYNMLNEMTWKSRESIRKFFSRNKLDIFNWKEVLKFIDKYRYDKVKKKRKPNKKKEPKNIEPVIPEIDIDLDIALMDYRYEEDLDINI